MAKPRLIIDPGHGGKDPGGGSNKYWLEKDKVLEISLYQYNRFKELGVPVAITRTTDKYLSPAERTRIVRNSGAEYCISNHINAGGGDGAEVIYSIYDSGELARRIAQAIKETGQNIRRTFTRTLPNNPKLDYYFMNRDTGNVKTNIVEYGFADSPRDDVEQLKDHVDEAEAVVKAFCQHIGHKYVAPGKKETPKETPKPNPKPKEEKKPMDKSKLPVAKWFEEEYKTAVKLGITDGTRPQDVATRQEAVAMIVRSGTFSDRQLEMLLDQFLEVKDKLPLHDPDGWEERLRNKNLSLPDAMFLLFSLVLRSYK